MMTDAGKKPGLLKRMFPSLSVGKFSSEEAASFDGVLEDDEDDSCPSYKSVVINPASSAANQFFDSEQKKMVEIDNFSFDQDVNHFETRSTDSSLALLDPGCLEGGRDSIDLLEVVSKVSLSAEECATNQKPKILSPKDSKNSSFSSDTSASRHSVRRKLSDEGLLPSRHKAASPKTEKTSKIPRFHKRDRGPKNNYSPVQRKISCRRTEQETPVQPSPPK